MQYRLDKSSLGTLAVTLAAGESMFVEPAMLMKTEGEVALRRHVKGRFLQGLKRKIFAGGSFFLDEYHAPPGGGGGTLLLGRSGGGEVVPVHLHEQAILCRRNAFLGFHGDMDLDVTFALAEGEAFVLQKISGSGVAFIYADAYLVEKPERMRAFLRGGLKGIPLFGAPAPHHRSGGEWVRTVWSHDAERA